MKTDLNITTNADGILRASECGLIFGGYGEWDEQAISGFGENYYTEIPLHNARIIQSLLDMAEDRPAVNESNPEGLTTVLLPPGVICVGADVFRRGQTCLWINHDYTRLLGSGTPEKIGASPVDDGGTVIKTPFQYNEGINGEYRAAAIRIRGREYGNASRAARHHVFIENFTLDGGGEWTGEYEWDSSDKRDKDYGWDITHHGINVSVDDLVDYVIIKNITVKNFRGEMMYIGGHNTGYLEVTRCVVGGTNASCNNLDGHTVYCHENQWGLEDSNSRFWMEYSPRRCQTGVYSHQPIPGYAPAELHDAVKTGRSASYFYRNTYINSDYTKASCIAVAQAMNDDTSMYFVENVFDNSGVLSNYKKTGCDAPDGRNSLIHIAGGSAGGEGRIVFKGNRILNHPGPLYDHQYGGATGEGIWFLRSGNVWFEDNICENVGAKGTGLFIFAGSWPQYPMYADNVHVKRNRVAASGPGVVSVAVGGDGDIAEGVFEIPWMGENGTKFTAGEAISERNVNNNGSGEITYGKFMVLGDGVEVTDNEFAGCLAPVSNFIFKGRLPLFANNAYGVLSNPVIVGGGTGTVKPVYEKLNLYAAEDCKIDIASGLHRDGQPLEISVAAGSRSIEFNKIGIVAGAGEVLRLIYSGDAETFKLNGIE